MEKVYKSGQYGGKDQKGIAGKYSKKVVSFVDDTYDRTCLYIGRFQPFHRGHLDTISQIFAQQCKNIVIGVGSINKFDERNPRTFPQRKEMIMASLKDAGYDLSKFQIVGIPDFSEDEDRLSYITETIEFDCVMSGNPWVVGIFENHHFKVLQEQERIPIHGTDIRKMIQEGDREEVEKRAKVGKLKNGKIKEGVNV